MKTNKFLCFFILIYISLTFSACLSKGAEKTEKPAVTWNTPEELVSLMTLEEKIGQMTQAEQNDVLKGDIKKYALGSVLSGGDSIPPKNNAENWVAMINRFTAESFETRLGIPIIYGLDAVHGQSKVTDAVMFPHNIGLGAIAAGNRERGIQAAYTAGKITAEEMRATNVFWTFSPVIGVAEDVRWGRTYECFSENVEIVTFMGESLIKGLQDNGVAACMKHYIGEGQTINGKNQGNALLDRDGINRILPPYRAAVNANALTLMPSYSSVNGLKMHEHKELLTDVLKNELNFKGFVISDWDAVRQLSGGSYKVQIANAINAGVDMVMATGGRNQWILFIQNLKALVEEGAVPISRIDDAALRIIRVKQQLGFFKETDAPFVKINGIIGSDENRIEARAMVSDSMVLLRNENNIINRLPSFKNILIAGQGADNIGMQCGGWTVTWQGRHGPTTKGTTIFEGIKSALNGKADVTHSANGNARGNFDAVIAVIGEGPYAEGEGDRSGSIDIRANDRMMLRNVYNYKCPVIVIMLSGRPMNIGDEYNNWDGFIAAWLPGSEGGGIADVLFGVRDFTGRTPFTWRKNFNGEILYPFGFGLTK